MAMKEIDLDHELAKFFSHNWNPLAGECRILKYRNKDLPGTSKRKYSGNLRLVETELLTPLVTREHNRKPIAVCTVVDMFSDDVPNEWIDLILEHCREYPDVTYLFQTRFTQRLIDNLAGMPPKVIFGTFLETDRENTLTETASPSERVRWLKTWRGKTMVSIDPIMKFSTEKLIEMVKDVNPAFVLIGADSNSNNLDEPDWIQINVLIHELEKFTEVLVRKSLLRIKEDYRERENERYREKAAEERKANPKPKKGTKG